MPSSEPQLFVPELKALSRNKNRPAAPKPATGGHASAVYLMTGQAFEQVYGPEERAAISSRVKTSHLLITPEGYRSSTETWPDVEIMLCGWGMVSMDEIFFCRFPKLKVIFYAAGTVRGFVTDDFWRRKIRLTNAAAANAVPVAEFTLAQILLALKHGWQQAAFVRKHGKFPDRSLLPGAYRSTVALISLGAIGRLVAKRLRDYDLSVVAYDPICPAEVAAQLNVKLVSLEKAFALADVVSCHAPVLKETERMIRREHFGSMKPGATFINTARGAVVDEEDMIQMLKKRTDIFAVLDVTDPMPPVEGSPLYALDNVLLTPHIAGCLGRECQRMGKLMVEELDRYLAGEPLQYEIDQERFRTMA